MTITEIFAAQESIIRLQSEVIDGLFMCLSQYIAAEELDTMPEIEKINAAARIRADIERE